MRKYWLLNQHGADGPTALVETDGSMHIARILRFGPDITELDDQQAIQERVKKAFSYPIDIIKKSPETFDVSTYESMSSMAEYKRLKEALEKFKEK